MKNNGHKNGTGVKSVGVKGALLKEQHILFPQECVLYLAII